MLVFTGGSTLFSWAVESTQHSTYLFTCCSTTKIPCPVRTRGCAEALTRHLKMKLDPTPNNLVNREVFLWDPILLTHTPGMLCHLIGSWHWSHENSLLFSETNAPTQTYGAPSCEHAIASWQPFISFLHLPLATHQIRLFDFSH